MLSTCVCVCMCVCVIFLHHSVWYVKSVVLFYSCILLLWYVGYDDFISMNNVFVFVLIIIISLLVLLLANMEIATLEKYLFSISHKFWYFFLFFHFIYFCISSIYIFLINFCSLFCFSLFWYLHFVSNSFTLILFLFLSFTLSVCWYFFLWFSLFLF